MEQSHEALSYILNVSCLLARGHQNDKESILRVVRYDVGISAPNGLMSFYENMRG
jgi:hypothetical protein